MSRENQILHFQPVNFLSNDISKCISYIRDIRSLLISKKISGFLIVSVGSVIRVKSILGCHSKNVNSVKSFIGINNQFFFQNFYSDKKQPLTCSLSNSLSITNYSLILINHGGFFHIYSIFFQNVFNYFSCFIIIYRFFSVTQKTK